ncbi:MAG: polysaccharide deacetylase family protein [Pseudomonadota bacterium]
MSAFERGLSSRSPALSVVMHDVAPATWEACSRLLDTLEQVHPAPVSLLVVADYHRRGRIEDDADFLRAMERRQARGDEILVHGLIHLDDSPRPQSLRERFFRRFYTASEGEFCALNHEDALQRMQQAYARFKALGWSTRGFVAPAWLMGEGAQSALRDSAFDYSSTRRELVVMPSGQRFSAPSLVWSVRAAWRRRASAWWNTHLLHKVLRDPAQYPLLRLGLHPADVAHPDCVDFWRLALDRAVGAGREPITKGAWLARQAR